MTLADAQARASLVLATIASQELAQRARQTIIDLAMTACGKGGAYQPSGSSEFGERPPTSGDPNPPHIILTRRIASADTEYAIQAAVRWGETELERLRHQPAAFTERPETERERHKRIVGSGKGWTIHEVASALKVAPSEVRQARIAAGRDVATGEFIPEAKGAGGHDGVIRALKNQGWSIRQIADRTGVGKSTVQRVLAATR